ncbi:MAG: hypothetical protein R3Y47_02580 [Lachnospiraceae bacterium]
MRQIRKTLLVAAPTVAWTLLFMIIYTLFMSKVQDYKEFVISDQQLYYRSITLAIPLAVLTITIKKTKYLWQYLLVAILLIAAMYFSTGDWFLVLITAGLCFIRLISRLSNEPNVLDSINGFMIAALVIVFVMMGFSGEEYLQKMTLYHIIYLTLLAFTYWGLQRFEEYIMIRESRANVPAVKILDTGTKIFVVSVLLCLIVLLPLMEYKYELVSFSLPQVEQSDEVWEEEINIEEREESNEGGSMIDMLPESEPNKYLVMFWQFLSNLMVIAVYVGFVYAAIRGIRAMIRNYKAPQIEKYDVIESTFVQVDAEANTIKVRAKLGELFGFSKEMTIRRKYKKALNKYHPKAWQSPDEMEKMAELDIPELHELYEEARYAKHS